MSLLVAVAHLCLALKDLRLAGDDFLIVMFASPYLINRTLLPDYARTANFLVLVLSFLGLLYPENLSPLYVIAMIAFYTL